MALPKINQPLFELTIPSTKVKVKFRPFTVKEEKILLIAKESEDFEQVVIAIKQIINNCIDDIDVDALATFDLEYIIIQLRSKSVNDNIEMKIVDPDTKEEIDIVIDLNELKVNEIEGHTPFVKIQDDIMLHLSYPTLDVMKQFETSIKDGVDQDKIFNIMIKCMKEVIQGDDVYQFKDFSSEEVSEFVGSMSIGNLNDIKKFFDTMPTITYKQEYTLKDGTKKDFIADGMNTFFLF